jgi:hypothetical protein
MVTILRSLGAAVVLVLVVVSTASAGAPERHSERGTIDGWGFAECDGFDIIATGGFSIDEALFTNRDGSRRIVQQFKWDYTMWRTDNDTVVGTGGGSSVLLAPIDGTPAGTWVGVRVIERFVDGSTVSEIGRITWDTEGNVVFDAGRHPFSTIGVDRCEHVEP